MDCQKHLFALNDNQHYLNGAYLSPLLKSVEQAGVEGIQQKRTPWRLQPEDFFEDSARLRSLFAQIINAENPEHVAIIPSVSYGIASVANNLPQKAEDKKIIVADEQFPSNVYSWKRYCRRSGCKMQVVKAPAAFDGRGQKWNKRILEAIDSDTLMVALANIHWADGTLFNLQAIGKRVREVGAYFVIDGTQSVGALPFDVQRIKPDALICAGYKWLMGPYSIGLGYFGDRFHDGTPVEENWINRKDSENFSALTSYADAYQPGAIRYDVGERSNFILVPMMIEALKQILDWQPGNIQNYCKALTQELTSELHQYGYHIENSHWRAHHLFGIRLPDYISTEALQQKLQQKNIHLSVRGSALRVSPNVYNEEKDIAALREVLVNQ